MSLLEDAEVNSGALSVIPVFPSFKNIKYTTIDSRSSSYDGLVKSGAGFLNTVIVNTTAAGTVIFYDNTAPSGTKIGTFKASIGEGLYQFQCKFSTGLYVETATGSDLTITYR